MSGKILVFDGVNGDSTQLRFLLASAHYEIVHLNEPEDVVNYSLSRRPDLILISGDAEDPVVTEICQTIVSYATVSDIPVVLVTGACGPSTRIEALRMGVSEVFRAPVDRLVLLARLRSLLRASDDRRQLTPDRRYTGDHELMDDCKPFTGPARIGLVAADAEAAWHLQQRLTPLMNDQFILFPEDSALGDSAMRNMADVFVIAADLTAPSEALLGASVAVGNTSCSILPYRRFLLFRQMGNRARSWCRRPDRGKCRCG
jgi:two-component system cell cycle response regulator